MSNDGKNKINTSQALALAGELASGIGSGLSGGSRALQPQQPDPSTELLPYLLLGGVALVGLVIITRRR